MTPGPRPLDCRGALQRGSWVEHSDTGHFAINQRADGDYNYYGSYGKLCKFMETLAMTAIEIMERGVSLRWMVGIASPHPPCRAVRCGGRIKRN